MKEKLLKPIVLCLILGLTAGLIAATAMAQEVTDQKPQLLIKIRNVDQLLKDVEKLISSVQRTNANPQPTAVFRSLLQGGDWIDKQRSIVVGVTLSEPKPKVVALIPFSTANPAFQAMTSAVTGENYYLAAIPPAPGVSAGPVLTNALLKASAEPSEGTIVIEAAMSTLLDRLEPQMTAALKNIPASPPLQPGPAAITPQESMEIVTGMLKTLRQAETVRYGIDMTGDVFTLLFGIDALPGTPMADMLSDPHAESRLMDFPIDMPLQIHSRSHNVGGLFNLMGPGLGSFYRRIGLDLDKMSEVIKNLTGETAGGISISSKGLAQEFIYVLRPGVDGDSFIANTYLPWLENHSGLQLAALASPQTGKPPVRLYERTADSTVAGIKVRGVKVNLAAILPAGNQQPAIFKNQAMEFRLAAAGDLMFVAGNDAGLESLIARSRSLKKSPAQGPTVRLDVALAPFVKGIQSLSPSALTSAALPENLGNLTMKAEMNNGKLATKTSFNMEIIPKLAAAIQAMANKQAAAAAGAGGAKPVR
jgi:hypothetical protein